ITWATPENVMVILAGSPVHGLTSLNVWVTSLKCMVRFTTGWPLANAAVEPNAISPAAARSDTRTRFMASLSLSEPNNSELSALLLQTGAPGGPGGEPKTE